MEFEYFYYYYLLQFGISVSLRQRLSNVTSPLSFFSAKINQLSQMFTDVLLKRCRR